ncbi:MAG: dihydroorotate dehydrogenase [Candidatus Omnitrophica bacterium]|nr:dihydroorotate dehydrogenase [Candidatus Omnitrophota bacterium]
MHSKIKVNLGKLKLKNPVMVASGTFGYANEFKDLLDLKKLGAIVTKTITIKPRVGNPMPRTCETPAGMLNSIGLENPGIKIFLQDKLPLLKRIGIPVIVSIASEESPEEFVILARALDKITGVAAIELNISCPNIQKTKLIAQDGQATYDLVSKVRKATKKPVITKLSPNVSSISEIAQAAESAGSDAVSLINTLYGMSIDIKQRKSKLASLTGGLSGPAVRPVAVKMVWEVYNKIKIPIIGMGGIMSAQDALEFIIAGASAISIGTANFVNPGAAVEIASGIKEYLSANKIKDIKELTGSLKI